METGIREYAPGLICLMPHAVKSRRHPENRIILYGSVRVGVDGVRLLNRDIVYVLFHLGKAAVGILDDVVYYRLDLLREIVDREPLLIEVLPAGLVIRAVLPYRVIRVVAYVGEPVCRCPAAAVGISRQEHIVGLAGYIDGQTVPVISIVPGIGGILRRLHPGLHRL